MRSHVLRQVAEDGLPSRPVDVLTPLVPMVTQRAAKRRGQILHERAQGLPVTFHPNCSAGELQRLYAESDLYWHATGVGRDVEQLPHVVEHFGISIIEAMSARCIPIVFAAGGPAVIVQDGVNGFHFHTLDDLVAVTRRLLESVPESEQDALRNAAETAAQSYSEEIFTLRVREIAARVGTLGTSAPLCDPVAS